MRTRSLFLVLALLTVAEPAVAVPPPQSLPSRAAGSDVVVRGKVVKTHVVPVSAATSYAVHEVAVSATWKRGVGPALHPEQGVVIALVTAARVDGQSVREPKEGEDVLLFLRAVGPFLYADATGDGPLPVSAAALAELGLPRHSP